MHENLLHRSDKLLHNLHMHRLKLVPLITQKSADFLSALTNKNSFSSVIKYKIYGKHSKGQC